MNRKVFSAKKVVPKLGKMVLIAITAVFIVGSANAQAYQQLNIESNSSRYNRELEELRRQQELERIRQGNTTTQGAYENTIVNPNANVLQKNSYSDGKVVVYIENKSNSYRSNCGGQRKADELIIENISNQTITVKYSFRHLLFNCNNYQEEEKTTYKETTLRAGEKTIEAGYLSNGRIGYYYVDAFSVIYVQTHGTIQNYDNRQTQQTQSYVGQQQQMQSESQYNNAIGTQSQKIAYINQSEIIVIMPEYRNMQNALQQLQNQFQNDLDLMRTEYEKKYQAFMNESDNLPESIKTRRVQEILDLEQRVVAYSESAQQKLQERYNELLSPIQEKIRHAIQAVGAENGFTSILDGSTLLFISPDMIDATPLVQKKLRL